MTIKELQRTHGNFTGHNTRDFPLDCEGMEALQMNETLLSVLGNIGGEKYKFSEPTITKGAYVFLATAKEPTGELLYVEKKTGTSETHVHIHTEHININAHNNAYTKRWLKWGGGDEQFTWNNFTQIETNLSLQERVTALEDKVIDPTPVGAIVMWGIGSIPASMSAKWRYCNGESLEKSAYPELYAVLGGQYGETPFQFNLPQMCGKFLVGQNPEDTSDFGGYNQQGGAKTVTLQTHHLPDFEMSLPGQNKGDNNDHSNKTAFAGGDKGQSDYLFNLPVKYSRNKQASQYGQSIKILPPYITMSFIIKIK